MRVISSALVPLGVVVEPLNVVSAWSRMLTPLMMGMRAPLILAE
jgi:hypothetical protein